MISSIREAIRGRRARVSDSDSKTRYTLRHDPSAGGYRYEAS